ncbi:MAG: 2-hydroxyacyl-CoA dehydratase [Planctomycetes bacterium]|nr:2-hydroxyacyl-CoA dehydratase [Planctomycetota bacterium]
MPHLLPPTLPRQFPADRALGITTTVPVEVILAAGLTPIDLNNLFVTSREPKELIRRAERAGFPRTCCCWTKGIYGAVHDSAVRRVLTVARGDCSNAEALAEVLRDEGIGCIRFDYPAQPDPVAAKTAIKELARRLGTGLQESEQWRERLAPARQAAARIDRLSWQEQRVHGVENHLWLVSTSDFCSDPDLYQRAARDFLRKAGARPPIDCSLRLGLCGIPPIVPELYDFLESFDALVLYNETQRQFAMPAGGETLAEQYSRYTYPYGIFARLEDIRAECRRRRLDGLIHYVQSFCHRRIEDRIIRDHVDLPVLTLEADRPGPLSGQLKTRLEAFAQMLDARKNAQ